MATRREVVVGVAGVVSGLVIAFIGAYGNHLGVTRTIEHQNEALQSQFAAERELQQDQFDEERERQQQQFDEERSRTIAEQREDVYFAFLGAADTSFHASQAVATAVLYCEGEANDALTCDQDDAEYLAVIDKKSDAIVAYRDKENQVYVYGSNDAVVLAEEIGLLLEEHFRVPSDEDTPSEYSRLKEAFLAVVCEDVPAVTRSDC
jgi:hypothetical protein